MASKLRIWLAALFLALPLAACATDGTLEPAPGAPVMFPANGAQNVNPDTHLVLTFASPPGIGTGGLIRIFDAQDGTLVDTLDMSVPASPNPNGRSSAANEAERQAQGASTAMTDYQVTTIGGTDFHFFPIIVRGNTATIYPHNGAAAIPDLAKRFEDGFGVRHEPTYMSIARGSYTPYTNATYPYRDISKGHVVVSKMTSSNGVGGSYDMDLTYFGGQDNVEGRGFAGFDEGKGGNIPGRRCLHHPACHRESSVPRGEGSILCG